MKSKVTKIGKVIYRPKTIGLHLSKRDAQIVGETAQKIYEADGSISPRRLLDVARPARSKLHHLFDWDDRHAADQYRLEQARKYLASYEVVIEQGSAEAIVVRGTQYVNSKGGYVPSTEVVRDRDMLAEVVEAARREARSWHDRYVTLSKFADVAAVIKAIAKHIPPPKQETKGKRKAVAA